MVSAVWVGSVDGLVPDPCNMRQEKLIALWF